MQHVLIGRSSEKRAVAMEGFKLIAFFQWIFIMSIYDVLQAILYYLYYFTRSYILCTIFSLQGFNFEIFLPRYLKRRNIWKDKKKRKEKRKKSPKYRIFGKFLKACDRKIFDLVEFSKFYSCEKNVFSIFSYFLK